MRFSLSVVPTLNFEAVEVFDLALPAELRFSACLSLNSASLILILFVISSC